MSKQIAHYTAEQTARFFGGGDLGAPIYDDPEVSRRMAAQRKALRSSLRGSVGLLAAALDRESPQTAQRLQQLHTAAQAGDPESLRLFNAMVGELIKMALQ